MAQTMTAADMLHAIKRAHGARDEAFVTVGGKACFCSTWNLARWLYLRAIGKEIEIGPAHDSCKRVAEFEPGQDPGTELSALTPEAALDWMAKLLCPASE